MNSRVEELRRTMMGAQVAGKGQYFQPGLYSLEVEKVFYKRSIQEGVAKENIIAEFKVLESSNPDCEVGSTRSVVFSFKHAGWMGRFKALVLALCGEDPDSKLSKEKEDEVANFYAALIEDDFRVAQKLPPNFLGGLRVKAQAMAGQAKSGQAVTNMKWIPVKG